MVFHARQIKQNWPNSWREELHQQYRFGLHQKYRRREELHQKYRLAHKTMYVTLQSECWKLQRSFVELVPKLKRNQEEADTSILLHAQQATMSEPVVIHLDDTGVLILLLSHSHSLHQFYIKKGKSSKTRIMKVDHVVNSLFKNISPGMPKQDFLKSLNGLHTFT